MFAFWAIQTYLYFRYKHIGCISYLKVFIYVGLAFMNLWYLGFGMLDFVNGQFSWFNYFYTPKFLSVLCRTGYIHKRDGRHNIVGREVRSVIVKARKEPNRCKQTEIVFGRTAPEKVCISLSFNLITLFSAHLTCWS